MECGDSSPLLAGDLSPSKIRRVRPRVRLRAGASRERPIPPVPLPQFDGDQSPRKSGDESPRSTPLRPETSALRRSDPGVRPSSVAATSARTKVPESFRVTLRSTSLRPGTAALRRRPALECGDSSPLLAGDLSPSKIRRVRPRMRLRAGASRERPIPPAPLPQSDGDQSPRKSGDQSPHSKRRAPRIPRRAAAPRSTYLRAPLAICDRIDPTKDNPKPQAPSTNLPSPPHPLGSPVQTASADGPLVLAPSWSFP